MLVSPGWVTCGTDAADDPPALPAAQLLADDSSEGTSGYTVADIRRAYGFDRVREDGRGQTIAIISVYHNPGLAGDLDHFDRAMGVAPMFGLPERLSCSINRGPHPCFQQIPAVSASDPDPEWIADQAAAVEWAHAMAPAADVMLVESPSPRIKSLLATAAKAVGLGASVVSMSWGVPESKQVINLDPILDLPNVTLVAASGDSGHGLNYPAASARVIAVGGTSLLLDGHGLRSEIAWTGSGGGISSLVPSPPYQRRLSRHSAGRMVPDVAFAARPGYPAYSSATVHGGWVRIEGTSIGTAQWAALIALINQHRGRRLSVMTAHHILYELIRDGSAYHSAFRDVALGSNGSCGRACTAHTGYNLVTGLGTPNVSGLVNGL